MFERLTRIANGEINGPKNSSSASVLSIEIREPQLTTDICNDAAKWMLIMLKETVNITEPVKVSKTLTSYQCSNKLKYQISQALAVQLKRNFVQKF